MRQTDRQTDRHTDSLRTLRNEHEHRSCNSYPSLLLLQRVPCWWCASSCLSGFALLTACHCDRVLCTCVCVLTYCRHTYAECSDLLEMLRGVASDDAWVSGTAGLLPRAPQQGNLSSCCWRRSPPPLSLPPPLPPPLLLLLHDLTVAVARLLWPAAVLRVGS